MPTENQELVKELVDLVSRWQDGNSSVLSDLAGEFRKLRDDAAGLLRDVSVLRKEIEATGNSVATLWAKFDKCYENRQERYDLIKKDVAGNYQRDDAAICSSLKSLTDDFEKMKATGHVKKDEFDKFRQDEFSPLRNKFWWIIGIATGVATVGSYLLSHLLQHHT